MSTYKQLSASDNRTARSVLNQLVDFPQSIISGTVTRRKYQVFVTGGVGAGVTSSLYQTIYDQDYSLQTANALFDMTFGLHKNSLAVSGSTASIDTSGKYLFFSQSVQMREKMDIYKTFAQRLLGDAESQFVATTSTTTTTINEALFINFKRLFHRDQIKRESFAMKFFPTGSENFSGSGGSLARSGTVLSPSIFTDVGAASNKEISFGGQIGTIVDSSNTNRPVGLMFYDQGVAVLDMRSCIDFKQGQNGIVSAMRVATPATRNGSAWTGVSTTFPIAGSQEYFEATGTVAATENGGVLYPFSRFLVSGSIDDIVDHIAVSRFGGSDQANDATIVFQNATNINSTLILCRAAADEFNYSSNPTFVDDDNRIVVIDEGQEESQQSLTFITSVGLYDANNNLLAVAKLSRPVQKDSTRDLQLQVRLDW